MSCCTTPIARDREDYRGCASVAKYRMSRYLPSPPSNSQTVIDLCSLDSPVAAASYPTPEIITILDEDGFDPENAAQNKQHQWSKTDPNELLGGDTMNSFRKRRRVDEVWFKNHDDDDSIEVIESKVVPPRPELLVLDVFPDADLPSVLELLTSCGNQVATVLQHMAENSYKKSETKVAVPNGNTVVHMQNKTTWKYDYTSTESFVPTPIYRKQAIEQLQCDFPFLNSKGASVVMKKFQNHYAVCHDKLVTAVKGTGDDDAQYERILAVFQGKPLQPDQVDRIQNVLLAKSTLLRKHSRSRHMKPLVTDAILQDELRYVGSKVREWMEAQQTRRSRETMKQLSQRDGTAVECSCCYDSYPMDDMVSCRDEGHLLCIDCLKSFTENLVFGNGNLGIDKKSKQPALELKCFHGDGCSSGFHRNCLEKALPSKSFQKYEEVQFQLCIARAGLSANVSSCPNCGFQADVPKEQKIFQCPVAECGYASCRECGEAVHIPLRYVCVTFVRPMVKNITRVARLTVS